MYEENIFHSFSLFNLCCICSILDYFQTVHMDNIAFIFTHRACLVIGKIYLFDQYMMDLI